jgi:hypothetical protein
MPNTAAFIDSLRTAFGAEAITLAMRRGAVDGSFWAIEAGHVYGRPSVEGFARCGMAPPADQPLEHEPQGFPAYPDNIATRR